MSSSSDMTGEGKKEKKSKKEGSGSNSNGNGSGSAAREVVVVDDLENESTQGDMQAILSALNAPGGGQLMSMQQMQQQLQMGQAMFLKQGLMNSVAIGAVGKQVGQLKDWTEGQFNEVHQGVCVRVSACVSVCAVAVRVLILLCVCSDGCGVRHGQG